MKGFIKNIRILREMVYLRFHSLMVFRLDFFAPFFIDGSLFFIQLMAFSVIYSNIDCIGSWDKGGMVLYIGTFSLLNAFNMSVCFFGVNTIPYKIRSGELDLYLSKPASPLFRITFENISPGSFPLVIMSICIILYGIDISGIRINIIQVVIYIFWFFIMLILYYDISVLMRSIPLYIVSMSRIEQLEEASIDLCMKLPGNVFYGIYKVFFYIILPYGIVATLPVQSITRKMGWQAGCYGIFITLVFSYITCVVWKNGLKHYNSASS